MTMPRRPPSRIADAPASRWGVGLPRLWFWRALVLSALFLLPVQMRAGAEDAHPHAMLELLLDARDGVLDHHHDPHREADHHEGAPDLPALGKASLGASLAILAVLVPGMALPSARLNRSWPDSVAVNGHPPALEPPPPRS
jgi:hypothetical protein